MVIALVMENFKISINISSSYFYPPVQPTINITMDSYNIKYVICSNKRPVEHFITCLCTATLHSWVKITAADIYRYLKIFHNQSNNQNNLSFSFIWLKMKESNNSNKRKQVGRVIAVEITDEKAAVETKRDIAKNKKQKQHIAMVKEQIFRGDVWTEKLFVSNPNSKINLYENNLKLNWVYLL